MANFNFNTRTPITFWNWIQKFFTELLTPVPVSVEDEQWRHFYRKHIFDKHWRYSRSNHGVDRSMWIL